MKSTYANRGKAFEKLVDYANRQYQHKGWGLITQVPTPTKNIKGRIIYEKKSITDFQGVAHGRAIAFDAKNTKELNRFDLKNIHLHQIDYLKRFEQQGGVSFLLIHFEKRRETFYVPLKFLLKYWNLSLEGGKKSITYEDIKLHCEPVKQEKGIVLHYLKYCG
jgi:recombination protein U